MAERRIDPVTFVLGGLSVAAGSIVLAGASLLDEARILLPVGLIAFGIALLVRVGTADGDRPATSQPAPSTAPKLDSPSDTADDTAPTDTADDTVTATEPTATGPTLTDASDVAGAAPTTTTDSADRPGSVDRPASDDHPKDAAPD